MNWGSLLKVLAATGAGAVTGGVGTAAILGGSALAGEASNARAESEEEKKRRLAELLAVRAPKPAVSRPTIVQPQGPMGMDTAGVSTTGPMMADASGAAMPASRVAGMIPEKAGGGMEPLMKAYIAAQGVGTLADILGGYLTGRKRDKAFRSWG